MSLSLHKEWVKAKKDAQTQFKEAEKNYIKKQDKLIKDDEKDFKARNKALSAALGEAGLGMKESLSDYLKFADGFGDSLDNLEAAIDKNAKLAAKLDLQGGIDKILANKTLARPFLQLVQRTLNTNMITYYTADYKQAPDSIYDTYIKDGAKKQLDFDTNKPLRKEWEEARKSPETLQRQGRDLADRTRDHVKGELEGDLVTQFIGDDKLMEQVGFITKVQISALKKTVTETAKKYQEEIKAAKKRWSGHKPQFWTPLVDCLTTIDTYCKRRH